jgi:hypothetical protein
LHSCGIVIVDCDKKLVIDSSKLIKICGCETDDDQDIGDIYEIVATLSECQNKALNTKKNFQLLDIGADLGKLIANDKKTI